MEMDRAVADGFDFIMDPTCNGKLRPEQIEEAQKKLTPFVTSLLGIFKKHGLIFWDWKSPNIGIVMDPKTGHVRWILLDNVDIYRVETLSNNSVPEFSPKNIPCWALSIKDATLPALWSELFRLAGEWAALVTLGEFKYGKYIRVLSRSAPSSSSLPCLEMGGSEYIWSLEDPETDLSCELVQHLMAIVGKIATAISNATKEREREVKKQENRPALLKYWRSCGYGLFRNSSACGPPKPVSLISKGRRSRRLVKKARTQYQQLCGGIRTILINPKHGPKNPSPQTPQTLVQPTIGAGGLIEMRQMVPDVA